mmetsp:Transcript_58066/g.141926  ORF Transcript_58066/g.141926 Transcript_58066/m.141926 type:complete len:761 (+) Transcript_58066:408-2690(+)
MNQPAGYHRSTSTSHASALALAGSTVSTSASAAAAGTAEQQQQQQPSSSSDAGPGEEEDDDMINVEPSNLDHALLESLFYSEMLMFDNNTTASSQSQQQQQQPPPQSVQQQVTYNTEKYPSGSSSTAIDANNNYNGTSSSAQLFSQHLAEAAQIQQQHHHHHQQQPLYPTTATTTTANSTNYNHHHHHHQQQQQQDLNNLVEEEILRQFELTSGALPPDEPAGLPLDASDVRPPVVVGHGTAVANPLQPAAASGVVAANTAASLPKYQTTATPNYHMNHIQQQQPPPQQPPPPQLYAMAPSQYQPQQHLPSTFLSPSSSHREDVVPLQRAESFVALEVSETQGVPQHRARQLVDQFATLASRLGIDLPDDVLQSLTTSAVKNDPSLSAPPPLAALATGGTPNTAATTHLQQAAGTTTPAAVSHTSPNTKKRPSSVAFDTAAAETTTATSGAPSPSENKPPATPPSTILETQKAAQEAIAAVTQLQKSSSRTSEAASKNVDSKIGSMVGNATGSATTSTSTTAQDPVSEMSSQGKAPTYSKRRKKPRKQECEAKLAQLRAENEQLKRHLENVTNKAHKFDKGKEEAMQQIERLMHENSGPEKMNKAVHEFGHMYSDYGVNRQQELNFHLEQLQRLANPTNFTKMGLWTLGQSSHDPKRNPIAGILVKELTITPQQGRKILDQSEKIRYLCQNLKETHALLGKLKALCETKTKIFQDRMSKCTEILTSKQVVALIVWINEHTDVLDAVCPGWGTEQIQKSNK